MGTCLCVSVGEKKEQKSDGGRQRLTSEELRHRAIKRYLAHSDAWCAPPVCTHTVCVCVLVQTEHSWVLKISSIIPVCKNVCLCSVRSCEYVTMCMRGNLLFHKHIVYIIGGKYTTVVN